MFPPFHHTHTYLTVLLTTLLTLILSAHAFPNIYNRTLPFNRSSPTLALRQDISTHYETGKVQADCLVAGKRSKAVTLVAYIDHEKYAFGIESDPIRSATTSGVRRVFMGDTDGNVAKVAAGAVLPDIFVPPIADLWAGGCCQVVWTWPQVMVYNDRRQTYTFPDPNDSPGDPEHPEDGHIEATEVCIAGGPASCRAEVDYIYTACEDVSLHWDQNVPPPPPPAASVEGDEGMQGEEDGKAVNGSVRGGPVRVSRRV